MDKTIKVGPETYELLKKLSKEEQRSIKVIADRAIKVYGKKVK